MINKERLLNHFLEYVQTDSETKHEAAMGRRVAEDLRAMGLEVITDNAGETFGSDGFNVLARFPGELPGEPMLLSAHMDTVVPGNGVKPQIIDGVISTDGTTVLGGDDKSGVCGIIEAVRVILEKGLPHRSAELLFSIGEEGGMRGAKAFDASLLKSKCGYIFDSSGAPGKIIVQAPGQMKIDANVIGKRAHAGLAPEQGISAIQVAAKGVAAMNLLRIDEETTCNIGTFTADFATNIVPDKVHIFGEIRSRNYDKLVAQAEHMRDCLQKACDEAGAKLECDLITNYVSYKIEEDSELVGYLKRAIEKIGCTPLVTAGGGGSDANIWNQKGIPSVVLGTGMTKVHTTEETLKVRDLEDTARLALALLTLE